MLIEVKVKEEKLAERTGLSVRAVSMAIVALEVDGAIKVSRDRDPVSGQLRTRVYIPLHMPNTTTAVVHTQNLRCVSRKP